MPDAFHVAAFAPDGELQGTGVWQLSQLSPRWLAVCGNLLRQGNVFHASPGGALAHLSIRLTSSGGTGLGMFFVYENLAASTAYFRGENSEAEAQMLDLLLTSLRITPLVRLAASSAAPFEALRTLSQRPLHVVVAWGSSENQRGESSACP